MKSRTEIAALLIMKKLQGEISEPEEKELDEWMNSSSKNEEIYKRLTDIGYLEIFLFDESISNEGFRKIIARQHDKHEQNNERKTLFRRLAFIPVAACLVLIITSHFYNNFPNKIHWKKFDIHGKYIGLRQVDGTIILLDTASDLPLPDQGDYRVYIQDDELFYTPLKDTSSWKDREVFNTILLPEGRHFRVALPDGSKVCLNAASSIHFPVSGNKQERTVELMGEGFFNIKADCTRPFIVKVKTSTDLALDILVTGTKFNVNAYCDDSVIRTTLVAGKIIIKSGAGTTSLNPGEEMLMGKAESKIEVGNDVSEVTAWKDDFFVFKDAPVQKVLNEIGRWYGWKVVIEGKVAKPVSLTSPRSKDFDSILNAICQYSECYIAKKERGQVRLKKK